MKKVFTSLALLGALMSVQHMADAQVQPRTDGKIKSDLSTGRFAVITPASIAGMKKTSIAPWGDQLSTPIINQPVVRGLDSLAVSPLTNSAQIAGKVCLLFRGGSISFRQKADYAVAAGAIALIIVNNIAGDPPGMANTGTGNVSIPVVSVSDVDGIAMNNLLRAGTAVNVSIGSWNLGVTHDLAILDGYQSVPHALNIPFSQLSVGANRVPYRNYVAGAILNYGTTTETGITVLDSVVFTDAAGANTTVHQSSYSVPSISPTDSVRFGFGNAASSYSLPTPNGTGYYTYNYRLNYGVADQIPEDNRYSYRQYVSDSIFCKSNYDYARGVPVITLGIQPANAGVPFSLGPLFYMADGKYAARKIQYNILKSATPTLVGVETYALIHKWVDGSAGEALDSFVSAPELTLVGIAKKVMTTADTGGHTHTLVIRDPLGSARAVILDSNSWYWSAAQCTQDAFIGVDQGVSYFSRIYEQSQVFNYQEQPEIIFTQDYNELATSTSYLATIPFAGHGLLIDSSFFDRYDQIPAIALHISKNKITSNVGVEPVSHLGDLKVYPVPANASITVEAQLTKRAATVGFRLLDIGGRVMYQSDKANLQNDRFTISTESIPSGIYYLMMMVGDDFTTRQVVVKH